MRSNVTPTLDRGFSSFPSEVFLFFPQSFQVSALPVLWPNLLLGGSTVAFDLYILLDHFVSMIMVGKSVVPGTTSTGITWVFSGIPKGGIHVSMNDVRSRQ